MAINVEQLFYRSPGGVGRYVTQLLRLLPALDPPVELVPFAARHPQRALRRTLTAAGGSDLAAAGVGLPLPRPLLYEAWLGPGWPPLPRLDHRLRGLDVVHAPSVAVAPTGGTPLVVTVHDAAPVLFPEAFPARGLRFHRRAIAAAVRWADLVITVSSSAADELSCHLRVPTERLRVVPNGVDPPELGEGGAQKGWLERLGLRARPFVLWVGSLEPRKNVKTLVAAMAALRRRGGPAGAELVLAGYPGWLSEQLIDPADRAVLGAHLHQLGQVSDDQLWTLYRHATAFAFPSLHEGFGLPVVEAMSQGTPVVCSDLAVLREVGGPAPRYVPATDVEAWAETLEGVLSDEGVRQAMGRSGAARAAMFTGARQAEGTRAVYREAAGR